MRVSLELAFDIGGLRKVDCPPQVRWALSNLGRHEQNKKVEEFTPFTSCPSTWARTSVFFLPWDWYSFHQLSWFSDLGTQLGIILLPAFLGLQLVDGTAWDFSASITTQTNSSYLLSSYCLYFSSKPNTLSTHTYIEIRQIWLRVSIVLLTSCSICTGHLTSLSHDLLIYNVKIKT